MPNVTESMMLPNVRPDTIAIDQEVRGLAIESAMHTAAPGYNALAVLGLPSVANLYLDRCQVDTPPALVETVWQLVHERRKSAGLVVDYGAGDARFAHRGEYREYLGFEIDHSRYEPTTLPLNAHIVNACAFSQEVTDADVCIGNPPYVRNQDLPLGWRQEASASIQRRTNVRISGLANAWQYFFMLSLASTSAEGLVAIVIPFEWVSRPSSAAMRDYIRQNGWDVSVYRLADSTFDGVLTTASITLVDKRSTRGSWSYYREEEDGSFRRMKSPTGGKRALLPYQAGNQRVVYAKRGLSPGTQEFLTLTESERAHLGLAIGKDVVPCITSLRPLSSEIHVLTEAAFAKHYVLSGKKCWLIRTDVAPSRRLQSYLDSVPEEGRRTSTCANRDIWWKFTMPEMPKALMATGFKATPKLLMNAVEAIAVGGVCGIYAPSKAAAARTVSALRAVDYAGRVVSHSNGLRKLEINQINALLATVAEDGK